jgi:hypothetical protein
LFFLSEFCQGAEPLSATAFLLIVNYNQFGKGRFAAMRRGSSKAAWRWYFRVRAVETLPAENS